MTGPQKWACSPSALRGTCLALWDDLLPAVPAAQRDRDAAAIADALAAYGGPSAMAAYSSRVSSTSRSTAPRAADRVDGDVIGAPAERETEPGQVIDVNGTHVVVASSADGKQKVGPPQVPPAPATSQ
jgi:hypothetical protein